MRIEKKWTRHNVKLQNSDLAKRQKITWLVSILVDTDKRDKILCELKKNNIDARAFFIPLSEMEIYRKYAKKCIESKKISKKGLNLPTSFEINEEQIKRIEKIISEI